MMIRLSKAHRRRKIREMRNHPHEEKVIVSRHNPLMVLTTDFPEHERDGWIVAQVETRGLSDGIEIKVTLWREIA